MKTAVLASKKKREVSRAVFEKKQVLTAYSAISFADVQHKCEALADLIEERFEQMADILLAYESFEVVKDETARTLDLLRNIEENKKYFQIRINDITSFLPRNQPLYSFACFVVIPSLMACEVHFRIPQSMQHFFPSLLKLLDIHTHFPNIVVSDTQRLDFLRERSALRVHPVTNETIPVTDAVIFTGSPTHAEQLRVIFDDRTLFITNSAGHNPVVVANDANLDHAVETVLDLCLYNQGQDCSAPSAALVHGLVFSDFMNLLRARLQKVRVGHYRDRTCRVGPISDPQDLVRIQKFLVTNRQWLDASTPGVIRASDAIVEPTIVSKPLNEGPSFTELFAPILVVQKYTVDPDLSLYFEHPDYAQHAMFISLYGSSDYIHRLIDRKFNDKVLHDKKTILSDTHPHAKGIERGTQAYGGYGFRTSGVSIHGKIYSKPTLPQRDIYEWIVKPMLKEGPRNARSKKLAAFTTIAQKNVEKLLRLFSQEKSSLYKEAYIGSTYIDTRTIAIKEGQRYSLVDEKYTYRLREHPNTEYLAQLKPVEITQIRGLRALLSRRREIPVGEFTTALYALAADPDAGKKQNQTRQFIFFQHVYQLLFSEKTGPRLPQFLRDVDSTKVLELLDF